MLRKARVLAATSYAHMLEYRAEIVLWMLAGLFPFILMGVWSKASAGGSFVYDDLQFSRYFTAVFIVRQLTVVWVIWEFETLVVEGRLSPYLLQPIDPVWRHVAGHITERLARAPFMLALLALFFLCRPEVFWLPSLRSAVLGSLFIGVAFALRFLIQYTFAMLAFWTERASALQGLWFLLYLFLSGLAAPLAVYPDWARRIADATPFPYLIDLPARFLAGLPAEVWPGAGIVAAWMLGALALNRFLWRRGLRRYSGMGA